MAPGFELDRWLDRRLSVRDHLRPLAIWLGLTVFMAGSIALGAALAEGVDSVVGPLLMILGVSLVGGGFTMAPTDSFLDPDIEFTDEQWYFVAAVSVLFLLIAAISFVVALL
jgi:hypothetical protein